MVPAFGWYLGRLGIQWGWLAPLGSDTILVHCWFVWYCRGCPTITNGDTGWAIVHFFNFQNSGETNSHSSLQCPFLLLPIQIPGSRDHFELHTHSPRPKSYRTWYVTEGKGTAFHSRQPRMPNASQAFENRQAKWLTITPINCLLTKWYRASSFSY
jgi:hypothetical protein